ncbi:MAG: hypothetical protein RLZZ436_361 [Planctomycetota bacterium]
MTVSGAAIASLLKRATTSRHSATSSASKNQSFRGGLPAATHASRFTESPHRRTARSDRPGDPACGPVAHHARHVRRCLPHWAAAAVASTSRGVDSTVRGAWGLSAVAMVLTHGKSEKCDIAIGRAARFTGRLTTAGCGIPGSGPEMAAAGGKNADR